MGGDEAWWYATLACPDGFLYRFLFVPLPCFLSCRVLLLCFSCSCPALSCISVELFEGSAMFELLRRQSLDLLGAYYADNVNDGMRGNTPSCDSMGPQNNRHVGDGSYCQPEDFLTPAERAATLGV